LNKLYRCSNYEIFSRNAAWSDDWRTERKMRDLDARLDLKRYGDGNWTPKRMCALANQRRYQMWPDSSWACGLNYAQHRPRFRTESKFIERPPSVPLYPIIQRDPVSNRYRNFYFQRGGTVGTWEGCGASHPIYAAAPWVSRTQHLKRAFLLKVTAQSTAH
jgi:hypothetical protein